MQRRLRVAVVGGGAAGMITAHLLDEVHDVCVFEAHDQLGGNVRTLGSNVSSPAVPPDLRLDAGVIEFSPRNFRRFTALLRVLDVPTRRVSVTSAFLAGERGEIGSPEKTWRSGGGPCAILGGWLRLAALAPRVLAFRRVTARLSTADLYRRRLGDLLGHDTASEWMRLLMVYAYSVPRAAIDDLPAALAVPTLRAFMGRPGWVSIDGGSYRYIAEIVARFSGEIRLATPVDRIERGGDGVTVTPRGGAPERFDRVVVATTPGQVRRLLVDASADEAARWAGWTDQEVEVLVHDDTGLYARRGVSRYSEFDVVEAPAGYNAYLNRLAGLDERGPRHFQLAYGLHDEVDPACVLHRQRHRTPRYHHAAFRTRPEILATNGDRHTYFVGAYLGDGLHEGAAASADRVSGQLGGQRLTPLTP
ncbi:MAG: FAD-dependent oxidoreductase, partial [Myxococcota bacterium]